MINLDSGKLRVEWFLLHTNTTKLSYSPLRFASASMLSKGIVGEGR